MFACAKDSAVSNIGSNENVNYRTPPLPDVIDERLTFDDLDDALEYRDYLEYRISLTDNADSLLNVYESQYAYTSLRSVSYFDEINRGDTVAAFADYFAGSKMLHSILNEHHEVGIGNDVYVYYGNDQTYKILDSDAQAISNFRGLPKNQDSIPYSAINHAVLACEGDRIVIGHKDTSYIAPPLTYRSFAFDFSVDHPIICEPWLYRGNIKVSTSSVVYNLVMQFFVDGVLVYQFSPGSCSGDCSIEFDNFLSGSEVYGIREYKAVISYTEPGNPTPMVLTKIVTKNILPMPCTSREDDIPGWDDNDHNNPVAGMSSLLWFKREFGRSYIGGETICWEWHSNGSKWKKDRGVTKVFVNGTFRNDNDCAIEEVDQESDVCSNCREKRASFGNGGISSGPRAWQDEELKSRHEVTNLGHTFYRELELIVCE